MTRVLSHKKEIIARLGDTHNARILEYGCGTGDFIELLLSNQSKPNLIYAVDSNEKMIDTIKSKFHTEITNGVVQYALCDTPRDLNGLMSFDRIICQNVLECIESKIEFINAFQDLLSDNGIFILSHHDFDSAIFNSKYVQLTRDLIHYFADTKQACQQHSDGQMGRKIPGLINQSVFHDTSSIKTIRTTETELMPGNYGYLMVQMLLSVAKDHFKEEDILLWRQDLEEKSANGDFYFAIDLVVAVLNGGKKDG